MLRYRISLFVICACLFSFSPGFAERVPLSPEKLQKESTHIVEGKVLGVYSRVAESMFYGKGTLVTKYVVEIEVETVVDGEDVKQGDVVYVRAWGLKKRGTEGLAPGPSGHFTIPKENDRIRVYAARGEYRATGQTDRGMTAVYPNGISVLEEGQKASE